MLNRTLIIRQFWQNLSDLVNNGVALKRVLQLILSYHDSQSYFANELKKIIIDMDDNWSFSAALTKNPKLFGETEANLIRIGETSDILPMVLKCLSEYFMPIRHKKYQNIYNFYNTLRIGEESKLPLSTSLCLAQECCQGELKVAVKKIYEDVRNGNALAAPMAESGCFCPNEVDQIDLYEEYNLLGLILTRLSNEYRVK